MTIDIITFLASSLLLWFGANWIVTSAALIARKFNVSELVIGLTIVALGTSAPEFLVTVNAAMRGHNDISLSNVVGSNIFNLGFILGLMAMIKPLVSNKTIVYRDGLLLFLTTVGILLVSMTGELGHLFGASLMALLIAYLVYLGFKRENVGDEELVLDEDVVFGPGDGGHQRLHDAVLGPVLAARPVTHTPHHLTRT